MVGIDEEGALAAQRSHRVELIEPLLAKHHGRIANTAGDSFLFEFPSAVEAVRCSLAIQDGMAERNHEISADQKIEYRIGINLGDVMADGDDLLGDGVNIAARLEALADAGGVCISQTVLEHVRDRIDVSFDDLGEIQVKNITRPVRVWRWLPTSQTDGLTVLSAAGNETLALPDKPSIAVLPFDNMSGDPEQEYFSDGISEDIITALSKANWLMVIARNSSFTYKGRAVDISQVGKELGVRYVLEGSVRKAGNRIRVTAQLIDTEDNDHLWAERYDRELADIFDLQDEITETITARIDSELRASEIERSRRKPPANLTAWDLYQRGFWHFYRYNAADNASATTLFKQAAEADPDFALAYSGIAYTRYTAVFQGFSKNPQEDIAEGLEVARKAVLLDDKEGFAHFVLGRMLTLSGDGEQAIAELEKSLDINPSFAHAYYGLSLALMWYGRAAEAKAVVETALRLSPRDPLRYGMLTVRANSSLLSGDHQDAVEYMKKAIFERNDTVWQNLLLAAALAGAGQEDEARRAIDALHLNWPDFTLATFETMVPHLHPEYAETYRHLLAKAGLAAK
ncbi:MAG: tetratricopeptide repeat protein [Rhodospirillaceae bacterium]|nr:tetratricopeptide repeat protein [Rhodospirillaceae bacterium]MBT4487906.1 tetratricopeptide repeat protein [Rhodospirillaceae bacterium]MBT5049002.1 tetratricopeptide repeat protein [Rhodospirillaceae bacterium]MBT6431243.1 tetratricopeptide repeat protein [Rhodospirillaceae bacterium]MBT7755772.1 tetratricopeptide repeat protein [Rhodospirillaceae bacterium]